MSRAKGTFMTCDRWVAQKAPRLPGSAGWVLLELSYQSNYDEKGLTVPELMHRLGKGQRTIEEAVKVLLDSGDVLIDPESAQIFVRGIVQDLAQALRRNLRQKWAKKNGLDDKRQVDYPWITGVNRKREKEKEVKDSKTGLECTDWRPAEPGHPAQTQAENSTHVADLPEFGAGAPAAGAASEDLLTLSQAEKSVSAGQKTATLTGGLNLAAARPATPGVRQEHHGDDHNAVQLFHDIAGYAFVARYRTDLARWHREYSPEFLRLAYRLSGTLPGAKGIWTFADVLNRDPRREWPEALQAQYRQDVQASVQVALQPADDARSRVRVGDLLRFADGETATVLRLDRAQAVTDSDDLDRGYVAYTAIGRSVEVLHS